VSYRDRIRACNRWDPGGFLPFHVGGDRRGWVRPAFAEALREWPAVFRVGAEGVWLEPALRGVRRRTDAVAWVLSLLLARGVLGRLHGEQYPVGPSRSRPDLLLDREAAAWFGIRAYGQHVNGVVRRADGLHMWVGRRAADKRNYPSRLDHVAAGGLPHGIGLWENLAKECWEEAGIAPALSRTASPVGALTYCQETESGLKPDTIYCYDLMLPDEFRPRSLDGEMQSFELLPVREVEALVRDTDAFKPNCSLVIIDFLIRHGRLDPGSEDYLDLVQGLHAALP
jgi:8-oxo-dGTP pyrophosphatase MutT (NUDIX family)